MQAWKTRTRHTILDQGKFLVVENHTVELPDGRVIEDWPWVITPDYVNICAMTDDGHFLIFRQTKYGIEGASLATPGGYLEPGEAPLSAAQRELREETGCEASAWVDLGSYVVDGNRGAGKAHLFLATGVRRVTDIDADDLEEQELLRLTRAEVEHALASGEFKAISWATVMALGLLRLSSSS